MMSALPLVIGLILAPFVITLAMSGWNRWKTSRVAKALITNELEQSITTNAEPRLDIVSEAEAIAAYAWNQPIEDDSYETKL
jgi:hypothetical protein